MTNDAGSGASDSSRLAASAEALVRQLVKTDRARKWQVRVLAFVCGVLLGLTGAGVWAVGQANTNARQASAQSQTVRTGAISACQGADRVRAADKDVWFEFLTIATDNPTIAVNRAKLLKLVQAGGFSPSEARVVKGLITAIYPANESPETQQVVAQLKKFIANRDAPVNCLKLYPQR